jgi:hypothetical protein
MQPPFGEAHSGFTAAAASLSSSNFTTGQTACHLLLMIITNFVKSSGGFHFFPDSLMDFHRFCPESLSWNVVEREWKKWHMLAIADL